jgi:hypothetical protein
MTHVNRGLAIALVMFCICGAVVISQPAVAQEMRLEPRKPMPEKTEELRELKERGGAAVSDDEIEKEVEAAKNAFESEGRRRANAVPFKQHTGGKFIPEHQPEKGKIELHEHDSCDSHQPDMVGECNNRR